MKNITPIILIQFLVYVANGLFAPAWYKVLFERGDTLDRFGLMIGLVAFGSVIATYLAGRLAQSRNPYRVLLLGYS